MSDKEKREVNEILGGIGGSLSNLGKDVLDLVKVGADKAQETIKDYQNKQSKVSDDKKAEDVKEEKSEEAEETKDEKSEETKEDK